MGESGRNSLETEIKGVKLREKDKNMGFFHRMANSHLRKNALIRIKINDLWLTEEQDIREGVANAFQTLLSKSMDWRTKINDLQFDSLIEEEASRLEVSF